MPADISFFIIKPPPERKATPEATARARLTKAERSAIRAYLKADQVARKAILRALAIAEEKAKLIAHRRSRRDYMRNWRSMKMLETVLL